MKASSILPVIVILSLVFCLSCGDDGGAGPGAAAYSRETPADVVEALAYALEHRDSDIYAECLADMCAYEFLEDDCRDAGVNPMAPWWLKDEDVAAMDSMFADPLVTDIEADFVLNGGPLGAAAGEIRVEIWVQVTVEDEGGGEPVTYWANGSWLHMQFVKDEDDSTLWQVSRLREELKDPHAARSHLSSEPMCTFGRLKAMFRRRTECEQEPRCSPECLLRAFEWAMEYRDLYDYLDCLRDEFQFEFVPEDWDAAGVSAEEPWWGKTEDWAAMSDLFASSDLVGIMCELEIAGGPWTTDDGLGYRLEPYMRFTVDYGGGGEEIVHFIVTSSWLDVEITEDPYHTGHWVFKKMKEVVKNTTAAGSPPGPGPLTEPSTFGSIKAMFK